MKCVQLNTGLAPSDEESVKQDDIKLITRNDMIQVTKRYAAYSDVVKYYYEYLKGLE